MKFNELEKIIEILQESPIRKYRHRLKENYFFAYEIEELKRIDKIIQSNKDNLTQPLKIVILGEVKAGKSTLVNTLIGQQVSYTNVVEATASIVEIKYATEEKIVIQLNEGADLIYTSLNELNALMDQKRDNIEFFNKVKKISIYTKIDRLREITIVDTPGLNTVTKENEERTENYIVNADVILWVLNAHHLGQLDVLEKIEDVMEYGKPIIGVINRIDEIIGSSSDELVEYVENEMGYIFDQIFAISAQKAWEGIEEDNLDKINISKIPELYHYLINNIEKKSEIIQLESIVQSTALQCHRDLSVHENATNRIQQLLTQYEADKKEFHQFNVEIKKSVRNKVANWLRKDFLKNERAILENCKLEELEECIKTHCSDKLIMKSINKQYERFSNYILEQWTTYTENIIEREIVQLSNPVEGMTEINYCNENYITSYSTDIVEGVTRGGITAGAVGLGVASYSAVLGPAAASVTLVSALSTVLPPLLIAGGIAGGVWNYFDKQKTERKNERIKFEKIESFIESFKSSVEDEISDALIKNLNIISDKYYDSSIEMLDSIFKQCSSTYKEMKKLQQDIKEYINQTSLYIADENDEYFDWNRFTTLAILEDENKINLSQSNRFLTEEDLEQILSNKINIQGVTMDITNQVINCIQSGEVDPYKTKQLKNEEIREKFIESFNIVEKELDIICPWIGGWVLNDNVLLNGMESALKRGVTIKILYGIEDSQSFGGSSQDNRGVATIKNAQALKERFKYVTPGKLCLKQGNTHQKLLLCDEKYLLSGSFNLLSFKGNYEGQDTRDESMEYLEHKRHIQDLRIEYFSFDSH